MIDHEWAMAATPDVEFACLASGAEYGAPLLLLHGVPYDHLSDAAVASLLAGAGVRAIEPALRGFGQTRLRPGVMPLHLADALRAMLEFTCVAAADNDSESPWRASPLQQRADFVKALGHAGRSP